MRLKDKVVVITGGVGGIGSATVRLFAVEGAKLVIVDVNENEGEALASELKDDGYAATFISLDVTNEQQWIRAVDATIEKYGQLDILVNNAGIFRMETVDETDLELWNRIQEVNATGVFLGIKHGAAAMRRSGGGSNCQHLFRCGHRRLCNGCGIPRLQGGRSSPHQSCRYSICC